MITDIEAIQSYNLSSISPCDHMQVSTMEQERYSSSHVCEKSNDSLQDRILYIHNQNIFFTNMTMCN